MNECLYPGCVEPAIKKWCPRHRQSGPRWEWDQKPLSELAPDVDRDVLERAMTVVPERKKPVPETVGVRPVVPGFNLAAMKRTLDRSQGRGLTGAERRDIRKTMGPIPTVRVDTAGPVWASLPCNKCGLPLGLGNEIVVISGRVGHGFQWERYHSPACVPAL
jgi:hypothetical protein